MYPSAVPVFDVSDGEMETIWSELSQYDGGVTTVLSTDIPTALRAPR